MMSYEVSVEEYLNEIMSVVVIDSCRACAVLRDTLAPGPLCRFWPQIMQLPQDGSVHILDFSGSAFVQWKEMGINHRFIWLSVIKVE